MGTSVERRGTRASTPRVRTGCQTCRKRHIKCDESKPACVRCIQAGWKCDGYSLLDTNVTPPRSDKIALTIALLGFTGSISSYSIPFSIPGSQKDRRILHYFCVQGCYEMAGYLDNSFWTTTVLQESHQEVVVLKALVSLSSLHIDYITTDIRNNVAAKDEALFQHGKVLRALQKRLEKPDLKATKVALTCCILFFCFEATLGNSQAAMNHLQNGLNLLSSYRRISKNGKINDLDILSSMFERLDLQATLFDDERVPCLDLSFSEDLDVTLCGETFKRVENASRTLITLEHLLFKFLTKNSRYKFLAREQIPAIVFDEKTQLSKQFDWWITRLNNTYQAHKDDQTKRATQALLVQWQVSCMLLEADYPTNEAVFGTSPNPRAEKIIALASNVLKLTGKKNSSGEAATGLRRNFSSDTGIVAPLFMLAIKCSDESVCLKAAKLLSESHRREGLYDSESMVQVVNKFQKARQKEQDLLEDRSIDKVQNSSLEKSFAHELDQRTGGMDNLVDLIKL